MDEVQAAHDDADALIRAALVERGGLTKAKAEAVLEVMRTKAAAGDAEMEAALASARGAAMQQDADFWAALLGILTEPDA